MKRTFKYALTAVLGIGLVAPAFAQTDNFPDVPENHWAYEALARLKKDGLLVGYPDGLFRGPRPASRYELAVAIHAVYTNLRNVTDGLQSQIDALKNNSDMQALKDQIAALQAQINALKGYGDDIANLKKLADTFQTELHALGVNVDELKKDLGDLARRVTALEAKKPVVDISGDINFFMAGANSNAGMAGLSTDGRLEGVLPVSGVGAGAGTPGGSGSVTASTTAGLAENLSLIQEIALTFAGTNTTGPTWKGTIVYGNALSNLGDQSTQSMAAASVGSKIGTPYNDTASYAFYVQDFSVKFNTSIAGLGFNTEVGRIGYKIGPYIFQRMNPNSYYDNSRWDNGEYYLDGASVKFALLGGKIDVFGGRTSDQYASDGTNINPLQSGPYGGPLGVTFNPIDRALGIDVSAPITSAGNIKVAYLWLDSDALSAGALQPNIVGVPVNRLAVAGGTINFALGMIKLQGDYSKTNEYYNQTVINDNNDDMWQAKASIGTKKYGIYGLYREIGANFAAPGDWGRIGILRNPTNIKGETVGGHINLAHSLILSADYEHEEGKDNDGGGSSAGSNSYGLTSGFLTGTKLDKYDIDLGYRLTSNLDVKAGFEEDRFTDMPGILLNAPAGLGGNPDYKWWTFGFSYGLSDAAKLTLQYQLSDVGNEFVIPTAGGTGGSYRGGLLTSQLTIKF